MARRGERLSARSADGAKAAAHFAPIIRLSLILSLSADHSVREIFEIIQLGEFLPTD